MVMRVLTKPFPKERRKNSNIKYTNDFSYKV